MSEKDLKEVALTITLVSGKYHTFKSAVKEGEDVPEWTEFIGSILDSRDDFLTLAYKNNFLVVRRSSIESIAVEEKKLEEGKTNG